MATMARYMAQNKCCIIIIIFTVDGYMNYNFGGMGRDEKVKNTVLYSVILLRFLRGSILGKCVHTVKISRRCTEAHVSVVTGSVRTVCD